MKNTVSLRTIMESQKAEVLKGFKARPGEEEESSFKEFKQRLEKETTPKITTINHYFTRPALLVHLAIFIRAEIKNKVVFKIDSDINSAMGNDLKANEFYEVDQRDYVHSVTGDEITNDIQIVSVLNIDELLPLTEIIGNAVSLIKDDLGWTGPLHEPDLSKDRNVNLGYCLIDGKVCVVYVERTKLIKGKKREYHIHTNICPRLYKPNRHIIYLRQ